MIAEKLYVLTYNGHILETFRTIPLVWDYLTENKLNFDFTYQYFERRLEASERFEFEYNADQIAVKLDYPNRGLKTLEWLLK